MTRINCIPPSELHDKHLLAEYRELPRIFALARPCPDAPEDYTLGAGHVKFFYDKLAFLYERQCLICAELAQRGFTLNFPPGKLKTRWSKKKKALWNDWTPGKKALKLNRARIRERLKAMKARAVK